MGIADANILFYHGILEKNRDNKIKIRGYNERKLYACFNNTFTFDYGIPDLNLNPMNIDDSP